MARFLHLSDLHLGSAAADDLPDDFKSDVVPFSERQTRKRLLSNTFAELREVVRETPLDAVVMTGDITFRNEEQGFIDFPALLDDLGDLRPENSRILVLPGNHDVTRRSSPSTPEHYEYFLAHVREAGFVTPLLDGVGDFDESGNLTTTREHLLAADDFSWVIVPINSSNYSGAVEPLPLSIPQSAWDELPNLGSRGDDDLEKTLRDALAEFRLRDAVRVSGPQLLALRRLLLGLESRIWAAGRDPRASVRIAAIHHQLLPVSTAEEFAQFETITNLGLLRNFLRENGFHVVLHGHKHTAFIYWDHIYPPTGAMDPAHRVLVVSGATIGGGSWNREEIARLIEVRETAEAPTLSVGSIPAVEQGGGMPEVVLRDFPLWETQVRGVPRAEVIQGATASEAYERIRAFFGGFAEGTLVPNVICQVADGPSALQLPDGYPDVHGVPREGRQQWFTEMIAWWQKPSTKLGDRLYFTHGGRIYAYRQAARGEAGGIDQVHAMAATLGHDPDSGRAVAVLLDPEIDPPEEELRKFPAFAIIQAVVRQTEGGRKLDCIGYFRKHEMSYWWPVNLGELAHVQQKILDDLQVLQRGITAGALTTVSGLAFAGDVRPRVAVPLIDRTYDEAPSRLWDLVYALFKEEDSEQRTETIREWNRYIDDMRPEERLDPDGVPVALDGVDYARELVTSLSRHHGDAPAARLGSLLGNLYDENIAYHRDTVAEGPTAERHRQWVARAGSILEGIRRVLDELTPQASEPGN